jgi:hypothetical protein
LHGPDRGSGAIETVDPQDRKFMRQSRLIDDLEAIVSRPPDRSIVPARDFHIAFLAQSGKL